MMANRPICVDRNWLIPIRKGMRIRTISDTDDYGNQDLTITGIQNDRINLVNSVASFDSEKPVHGKIHDKAKLWWIYEHCKYITP